MTYKSIIRSLILSSVVANPTCLDNAGFAQDSPLTNVASDTSKKLKAVIPNKADEPRATPVTRDAMKQYLEDLKNRTPRIPLPEATPEEQKLAMEDPRTYGYEGRLRRVYFNETSVSNYLPFGGVSKTATPQSLSRSGPVDPKMSLDYAFKVRLFWIAARGNNCQYCLGHQESKLLAAGMTEDQIAALDSEWNVFPENEQVAFELARKLTLEPHLVAASDIDACRKFYTDLQIIEMLGSISGNNAINRWKEGAGIPQSGNGGNFGGATTESHSYLTDTSERFAKRSSKVVSVINNAADAAGDVSLRQSAPTQFQRPAFEKGAELQAKLASVKERTSRLPLVDEATAKEVLGELVAGKSIEQWHRLLANFPIAGKRFASGFILAKELDAIPSELQTKIDWVVARQDRAWYAASLALHQLKAAGLSIQAIESLGENLTLADLDLENPTAATREQALLLVAKNLAASPIVLTDRQVEVAVKLAGPRAVAQTIHYTAFRAAFDRFTEAAGLGSP